MEDQPPSKLWNITLVFSLLLLAAILYVKVEAVRTLVDAKCPWVKEQLAKHEIQLPKFSKDAVAVTALDLASASATPAQTPASDSSAANKPAEAPKTAAPQPTAKAPLAALNLAQIAADQTVWPKKVRLKKDTTFPAVIDKKQVGKLNIPAGTEVGLYQVKADKLAVTYSPNGSMDTTGGTLIAPDDTDLIERVNTARH